MVVFGLIGVLVILRPGIASFNPAAFLVLAAAFGYAITMIATKKLTMTETTFGIVFWMAVIQLPLSLIGSDLAVFVHLGTRDILPAIGVGIAGLTSHYCLSNAFRAGDATLVVPLDFMRIPLIAVVGWALLRRAARHLRAARRADHHQRRAVEFARREPQGEGRLGNGIGCLVMRGLDPRIPLRNATSQFLLSLGVRECPRQGSWMRRHSNTSEPIETPPQPPRLVRRFPLRPLVQGTSEDIVKVKRSYTGEFFGACLDTRSHANLLVYGDFNGDEF